MKKMLNLDTLTYAHLSRMRLRSDNLLLCSRKRLLTAVQGNRFSSVFTLMTISKNGVIEKERQLFTVYDQNQFVDFFDHNESIVIFNFDLSHRLFEIRSTSNGQRLWMLNTSLDLGVGQNSETLIQFYPIDGLLSVGTSSGHLK